MKHIKKGSEPPLMVAHRKQNDANFCNIPTNSKNQLKTYLLAEQGHICCYCMQRIKKDTMKVEHWKPQKKYSEMQLDYKNLLASCKGGEGKIKKLQHCDTSKGEDEITISPVDADKSCERLVKFKGNGMLYSDDPDIDDELNRILNLNTVILKNNRSTIMRQVIEEMTRQKGKKSEWPVQYARKMIEKYQSKHSGKYLEYCQVVITLLKKRFSELSDA